MNIAVLALREWYSHISSARRHFAEQLSLSSTALSQTKPTHTIRPLTTSQSFDIVCIRRRSCTTFSKESAARIKRISRWQPTFIGFCAAAVQSTAIGKNKAYYKRDQTPHALQSFTILSDDIEMKKPHQRIKKRLHYIYLQPILTTVVPPKRIIRKSYYHHLCCHDSHFQGYHNIVALLCSQTLRHYLLFIRHTNWRTASNWLFTSQGCGIFLPPYAKTG